MKKALRTLLIAAVWLAIWQVSAMLVGQELLIPAPAAVLARLWALCGQGVFWKSVALSMGRILLGYLLGLALGLLLGVLIFFNHFGKRKLTTDPTPIEVQMRLYEDEVDTAIIQNASRKESGIDVH